MDTGDHVYVWRRGYTHHGIYCGNRRVIHYASKAETKMLGRVEITSVDAFANGGSVRVWRHDGSSPPEVVLARAKSALGKGGYHLVFNNCEHFSSWCKTGKPESRQARGFLGGAGVLLVTVLMLLGGWRRSRARRDDGSARAGGRESPRREGERPTRATGSMRP